MKKNISLFSVVLLFAALAGFSSCQKTSLDTPPPSVTYRPAGEFFKNNYEFTLFYAALQKAGLVDSLNGPGPFTIFAPNNSAFNLQGVYTTADIAKMNTDSLRFMLKFHILKRKLFVSDVPIAIDNLYANADGINLYLSKNLSAGGNDLDVNGVSVSRSNVILANGLVHVLPRALKYTPGTVQDILSANPKLSYFVTALKKFNLWDSLKTVGPYTIMAPVNNAFIKNGITLDSLNNLTPANYDPFLFKVYLLSPHHIFSTDSWDIGGSNFDIPDGKYKAYIYYNFRLSKGIYNSYYANFADANSSRDNVSGNGIVDMIDNLLYYPSDAHK